MTEVSSTQKLPVGALTLNSFFLTLWDGMNSYCEKDPWELKPVSEVVLSDKGNFNKIILEKRPPKLDRKLSLFRR